LQMALVYVREINFILRIKPDIKLAHFIIDKYEHTLSLVKLSELLT